MEKRRVKGGGGEGGVVLSMVHWGRGPNRGNRVGGVHCVCVCVCVGGGGYNNSTKTMVCLVCLCVTNRPSLQY